MEKMLPTFKIHQQPIPVGDREDAIAHLYELAPRELEELEVVSIQLRREAERLARKHNIDSYYLRRVDVLPKPVAEAVRAYQAAVDPYHLAFTIELYKLSWAMGQPPAASHSSLRTFLASQPHEFPTTQYTRERDGEARRLTMASREVRELLYDLPFGNFGFTSNFANHGAPPPAAQAALVRAASEASARGWRPGLAHEFLATPQAKELIHSANITRPTRFLRALLSAYATDAMALEKLLAVDAYRAVGANEARSNRSPFVKGPNAAAESLLVRTAVDRLGDKDACELFDRCDKALKSDRPTILEFFRLVQTYKDRAFWPGVPEFDLKPSALT